MNTRSFIKSLLIGCVAPAIFLPKEPVNWKRSVEQLWVPNPAWKDAEREVYFLIANDEAYNILSGNKLAVKDRQEFVSDHFVSFKDMFLSSQCKAA